MQAHMLTAASAIAVLALGAAVLPPANAPAQHELSDDRLSAADFCRDVRAICAPPAARNAAESYCRGFAQLCP